MNNGLEIIKEFFLVEKLIMADKMADLDQNLSLLENGMIDSLNILKLISFIEERFKTKVLDEELTPENFDSLAAISRLVGKRFS